MGTNDQGAAESGNTTEMDDPSNRMVSGREDGGEQQGAGEGEAQERIEEDGARQSIYDKHAAKRREQLGLEEAPDGGSASNTGNEQPADEEITVKVNGRERQVPKSKVDAAGGIDAYQKNAAASELLNQAAAETRRLREIEQNLLKWEQEITLREKGALTANSGQGADNAPPKDTGALRALTREYHEAIVDGDMDRADELLVKMQAAPSATAINPDEIVARAVQKAREELAEEENRKAAERMESERLEAVANFEDKHKDLATDPELRRLVNAKTAEIYQESPGMGPKAIIDEAIKHVRSLVTRIKTLTSKEERLDAKRSQTTVHGGSARVAARPAPKPQTRSQYVQELRKSRGLE